MKCPICRKIVTGIVCYGSVIMYDKNKYHQCDVKDNMNIFKKRKGCKGK
jgi:hypothetical protein